MIYGWFLFSVFGLICITIRKSWFEYSFVLLFSLDFLGLVVVVGRIGKAG